MPRILRSRPVLVSAVAAVALVLAASWAFAGRARTHPDLAPVPADRLLASSLHAVAARTPVEGTFRTHVDLGVPQLPSVLNDPGGPLGLLLADQTFKEWYGPDGLRVAQVVPFGERDLVVSRNDVWLWDSQRFTAWHYAVDEHPSPSPVPSVADLAGTVDEVLRDLRPYAAVSLAEPDVVAGRDAYVIRLAPATGDTLLGRIEVAIDAATRMPLRLEVFPRDASRPVVVVAYTSVRFGPIDRSMYAFAPPSGATVKQVTDHGPGERTGGGGAPPGIPGVRLFGRGFGLVVAVRVRDVPADVRPLFPYAGPLGSADLVRRPGHAWVVLGLVRPPALAEVESKLS